MTKSQINLPKTAFSMKANLPTREPEILEYWKKINLYDELRNESKGREKFILHDGPPYANGNIHMGTALNKILKDIIVKFHQMDGKDSIYVPGWDCHGLPIEWKIEEQYKKNKKNKNDVPIVEFRKECRDFANKWIEVHKKQFQRLGVIGDWKDYYSTMSFKAEAQIVRELAKFLKEGSLYKGYKPVLWSTVEKTALADAEVEYMDHISDTIYTSFPIKKTSNKSLEGCEIIIWTTTPWTIPANKALAYNKDISYQIIKIEDDGDFKNKKIVIVDDTIVRGNVIKSIIKIGVLTILMIAHSALATSAQTKIKSCDREVIFDSPPKRAISNDPNVPVCPKEISDLECAKCMMMMMEEHKGVKALDLDKLSEDDSSEMCIKCKNYTALSTSIKNMIDNL